MIFTAVAGDRDFHGILRGRESSHEMLMGWDFSKKPWRTWDGMKIISMFSWSNLKKVSINIPHIQCQKVFGAVTMGILGILGKPWGRIVI